MLKFARPICICGADLTKGEVKLEDTHSQLRVSGDPASGEFTLPFADCPKCGHPWPVIEAPAKAEAEPETEPPAPKLKTPPADEPPAEEPPAEEPPAEEPPPETPPAEE